MGIEIILWKTKTLISLVNLRNNFNSIHKKKRKKIIGVDVPAEQNINYLCSNILIKKINLLCYLKILN